jgi:FKBP-type peptidyl-prolyl cis-trans isomerase FkpA
MNCLKTKSAFYLVLFAVTLLLGCKQRSLTPTSEECDKVQKHMADVNRILIKKDRQRIMGYIERNKLDMQESGTGLWFSIAEEGKGQKAQKGEVAVINYRISLLDGSVCYDSDKEGPKSFLIGQGGVESGIEEGILMLKEGGKARFIMPPHLAYGLLGDEKKIPARAIIIYDVELVSLH